MIRALGRATAGKAGPTKIISYNLREHAARDELERMADAHDMDVFALQECDHTDMPNRIGHLELIEQTRTNRLGLALYTRADRFQVLDKKVFALRKSMHDRVLKPANERLLAAHLLDTKTGREVLVGDFHAAPLSATNSLRRKQIAAAHEGMIALAADVPAVMVGDFNYPWFASSLSRRLGDQGFQVSHSDLPTYVRKRFRGHFDFAISEGMHIETVKTLQQAGSDHLPVLVEARVKAPVPA